MSTFATDEVVRMRIALRRIAEIADAPTKDWSRTVGNIARAALENYALVSNAQGTEAQRADVLRIEP